MCGGYNQLYVHVVLCVHARQVLIDAALGTALEARAREICAAQRCLPLAVTCMPDHMHVLLNANPNVALAGVIRTLKRQLQALAQRQLAKSAQFSWAGSFGAYSVSPRDVDAIERYVRQQRELHAHQQVMAALECSEA
jgi:REP element-mobilizing transposase RayT